MIKKILKHYLVQFNTNKQFSLKPIEIYLDPSLDWTNKFTIKLRPFRSVLFLMK